MACLIKAKEKVNSLFQKFQKMIGTHYGFNIRVFHSNNGGEYLNTSLKQNGIVHQNHMFEHSTTKWSGGTEE